VTNERIPVQIDTRQGIHSFTVNAARNPSSRHGCYGIDNRA
jgi:hypothetical protein